MQSILGVRDSERFELVARTRDVVKVFCVKPKEGSQPTSRTAKRATDTKSTQSGSLNLAKE